jgi:RNA polymerase sigma-B factor
LRTIRQHGFGAAGDEQDPTTNLNGVNSKGDRMDGPTAQLHTHNSPGRHQTEALFQRLRTDNDTRAREELVRRFMPLARKLAARYRNPYEPFDDLLQVACTGLLAAIDRFDPDRGIGFASFAIPTILGELKRHFRNAGWSAHVPRRAQELALRVEKASEQLSLRAGKSPGVEEIAQYLELRTEDVLTGLEAAQAHYSVSLDAPALSAKDDCEPQTLGSGLGADDERINLVETTVSLSSALRELPLMEREALRLRVQEDLRQSEVALRLGCSQMQVSRLLRRAATTIHAILDPSLAD